MLKALAAMRMALPLVSLNLNTLKTLESNLEAKPGFSVFYAFGKVVAISKV